MAITTEDIENLITDESFMTLQQLQDKTSILSVVGQSYQETWHSSFIKWLLDPDANHDLRGFPAERLLMLYITNGGTAITWEEMLDADALDLDDLKFETEKVVNGGRLDIYAENSKIMIVIENKVKSKEHDDQTVTYRKWAENYNQGKNKKIIYLFLTPNPDQSPKDNSFIQITYQDLYDNVILKSLKNPNLSEDGRELIEQYANNLKEPIDDQPMALAHKDLCEEIYKRNGDILKEVFNDVDKNDKQIYGKLYDRYKNVFDEIFLSTDDFGRIPKTEVKAAHSNALKILFSKKVIKDGDEFTMRYNKVDYFGVVYVEEGVPYIHVLDKDHNELYIRRAYDGKTVPIYKTSFSIAASQAVYAYRLRQKENGEDVDAFPPSINGNAYWRYNGSNTAYKGKTVNEILKSI